MDNDGILFGLGVFVGVGIAFLVWQLSAETRLKNYPEWAQCILADGKWHGEQCYFRKEEKENE
jgi:hypothetical protein